MKSWMVLLCILLVMTSLLPLMWLFGKAAGQAMVPWDPAIVSLWLLVQMGGSFFWLGYQLATPIKSVR